MSSWMVVTSIDNFQRTIDLGRAMDISQVIVHQYGPLEGEGHPKQRHENKYLNRGSDKMGQVRREGRDFGKPYRRQG